MKKKIPPRRRAVDSSEIKVNSYISPRKKRSERSVNKRNKHKRKRIFLRVAIVTAGLMTISYFVLINARITGVDIVSEQQKYAATVEDYLTRNPVARVKFFISSQAITEKLLSEHPEVELAEVVIPIVGSRVSVDVVQREAQLVLKTNDEEYFLVDRNGFAYDTYDPSIKNEKVVILTDDTRVEYGFGQKLIIPSALIVFIEETDTALKSNKHYKDQTFSYRITDEARILYVKPSGEKYEIKMQLGESAEQQIKSLNSALDYYVKKRVNPIRYIDVRVNGTVYYR